MPFEEILGGMFKGKREEAFIMKSNFGFLEKAFPVLSNLRSPAENYLYSDTNSCLIKLGLFGETIVNLMFKLDQMEPPSYENTHANRIKLLKKKD